MTPTSLDRVKTYLARVIDGVMRRVDWYAWYPARVLAQGSDGLLELKPDNPRIPGLSKVPLRLGLPGTRVNVLSGARVLVGFEGGEPSRPVAALWERPSCAEIALDPSLTLFLGDGATQAAMHGTYFVAQLQTLHAAVSSAASASATAATAVAALAALMPTVTGPAAVTATPPQVTAFASAVTAAGAALAAQATAATALATAVGAFNAAGSAPPAFLSTLVKVK